MEKRAGMSSFFLLLQRDGHRLSSDVTDRLYQSASRYPHDRGDQLSLGTVSLGQTVRWISECDKQTELPLTIKIGDSTFAFTGDVRLDNRSELLAQLALDNRIVSHAELIIHAYLKWGQDDFADHLLGDFSFALYDEQEAKLICARDHLGIRPLYYHETDHFFLVSDNIEVILAHPEVSHNLNDGVVAEFALKGWVFNQQETFFSTISKCPRATCMIITKDAVRTYSYWDVNAVEPLQYGTEEEYVEHLQHLLKTVIHDRIDSAYPSGAHLSGGLDSSAIAVIAGRECKKRGHQAFYTYNWCHPRPGDDPHWHEWANARRIAEIEGFEHTEIDCNADAIVNTLMTHDIRTDGTTMFEYERVLLPQAQAKGVRVILSGFGGDEILTARFKNTHIDKIRSGRFLAAWNALKAELPEEKRANGIRLTYRYVRLLRDSLLPLAYRHRKLSKVIRTRLLKNASILTNEFKHYALTNYTDNFLHAEPSVYKRQLTYLDSGYHQERMESWAIQGRKHGVRYYYPYLDKRIVEFALSLPSSLYFKHGQNRHLYRQAVKHYLPDSITMSQKPLETFRVKSFLHNTYNALQQDGVVAMLGRDDSTYISNEKFMQTYHEMLHSYDKTDDIEKMMMVDRLKSIFFIKIL